jgi:hypothetical protein
MIKMKNFVNAVEKYRLLDMYIDMESIYLTFVLTAIKIILKKKKLLNVITALLVIVQEQDHEF